MGLWRKRGAGGACAACLLAASLSLAACAAPGHTEGQPPESLGPSPAEQGGAPAEPVPDQALLATLMGDADLASRLVSAAEADEDVRWIATHPDALGADGASTQRKLLSLAATEPAAVPFVRGFPDRYPAATGEPGDGPDAGQVPHLYQWDERWGYTVYGGAAFASTGCCPTALCMVYQGLTGKGDLTPYDMGLRAQEGGFVTEGGGTDAAFMAQQAPSLGLACTELDANAENLRAALFAGQVVVANMAPGDFTATGHYIVATGLDAEGQVVVNDPFSAERSARTWPVETVAGQAIAFHAFGLDVRRRAARGEARGSVVPAARRSGVPPPGAAAVAGRVATLGLPRARRRPLSVR